MHRVTKEVLKFAAQLATVLAFIVVTSAMIQCQADRAQATERQVEGLEYLGTFEGARVYRGPLGHTLSGCVLLAYPIPMGNTGYAVGCR